MKYLLSFLFFSITSNATAINRAIMEGIAATGNTIYISTTNTRVGIGNAAPTVALDVTGTAKATAFSGPITGNVTGNADTVTTNANLTGPITSVGNATTIAGPVPVSKIDLSTVTTAINLMIPSSATGNYPLNSATVTTNANLTGPITSVGNATTIAGPVPVEKIDLSTVTQRFTNVVYTSTPIAVGMVDLSTVTTRFSNVVYTSTPILPGMVDLSTVTTAINLMVPLAGGSMTGQLTTSSLTVTGGMTSGGGGGDATTGDFTVDAANKIVAVGRLSATGGNNTIFEVLNRTNNPVLYVNASSDISYIGTSYFGSGTTAPKNAMDVEGALAVGASYSGTTTGPSNGAIIQGNVGIGTNSPSATLDVHGDFISTGTVTGTYILGNGSLLTNLPATGGVTVATFTYDLGMGGDVFTASTTFIPISGASRMVDNSTWNITGVQCYTKYSSSVSFTSFDIAWSTNIATTNEIQYIHSTSFTVIANTQNSGWIVPDTKVTLDTLPCTLALHVKSSPASGTLPSEYGCLIKYWRRLDQ